MPTAPDEDRHAWERPGAFEVGPGVHRIPLPLPGDALRAVNIYAISDGDRVVLIDGGWAMAQSQDLLAAGLASIGYRLADIREFLVTHMHRDHYTQAVAVRRVTGSQVSLGEGEQAAFVAIRQLGADPSLPHPDVARLQRADAPDLAAMVAKWQFDPAERADYEDPDVWLPNGVELPLETRTLRVIATPGHTSGHVVFHDPQAAALFAGDHVLPHITPSISVQLVKPVSPLRDYLTSLKLMTTLPDARLLPAHGPVTASTHARVEELLAHHDTRLAETGEAVASGASSAFEVAGRLGWTRRKTPLADLDGFNQLLAVFETVAHLQVLVERGALAVADVDGIDRYTIAG